MKKKILFFTIFFFALLFLSGCFPKQQPIVGDDKDEHNCIGSAGYRWCEAKQKCLRIWEEGCSDEVYKLFNELTKAIGITFGEIVDNTMLFWQINDSNYQLPAFEMDANNIEQEKVNEIYNFLINYGFKEDFLNQEVKSLIGHSIGYSHQGLSLVCGVGDRSINFNGVESSEEFKNENKDIAIVCAVLDNIEEKISKVSIMKQLFVDKYNKKPEELTITISQETEDYVRGGIKFGLNGVGEGGIFLATIVDGSWQLVFDGNGSVDCQELREKYQFPDEILKPNFCD